MNSRLRAIKYSRCRLTPCDMSSKSLRRRSGLGMGELVAGHDNEAKARRDGLAHVEETRVIASQTVMVKRVDIDNIGSATVLPLESQDALQKMIQHNRVTRLSGGYRTDSAGSLWQNGDTHVTIS